jgi:LAS superfamily LD-carboxypeptidase LdcB
MLTVCRNWLIAAALVSMSTAALAGDCDETFVIDSVEYDVPARWCGKKLDSTRIADKTRLVRLPEELCFEDYRIYVMPPARDAFVNMAAAAKKAGLSLRVDSGYRSAEYQKKIIKRRLEAGEKYERIVRMVAPPGYSTHETGCAFDLVPSEAEFVKTDQYRWLKENAGKFGFTESIPENNSDSLFWEPYHWFYSAEGE